MRVCRGGAFLPGNGFSRFLSLYLSLSLSFTLAVRPLSFFFSKLLNFHVSMIWVSLIFSSKFLHYLLDLNTVVFFCFCVSVHCCWSLGGGLNFFLLAFVSLFGKRVVDWTLLKLEQEVKEVWLYVYDVLGVCVWVCVMMVMILLTIERDQIRESEKELYMSVCTR